MSTQLLQVGRQDDLPAGTSAPPEPRETYNAKYCATRNLSSEVLGMIFRQLVDDSFDLWRDNSPLTQLSISQVCRFWRAVALDTPILWTLLQTDKISDEGFEEFLARAGTVAPLRVIHRRRRRCTPRSLDKVLSRSEQLQKLLIEVQVDAEFFPSQLTRPAPKLDTLVLPPRLKLPADFLGGNAPCLRNAVLQYSQLHFNMPIFSNLRFLAFSGCSELDDNGVRRELTLARLLDFLEPLKQLRRLHLDLPSSDPAIVARNQRRIRLPNLSAFELSLPNELGGEPRLDWIAILKYLIPGSLESFRVDTGRGPINDKMRVLRTCALFYKLFCTHPRPLSVVFSCCNAVFYKTATIQHGDEPCLQIDGLTSLSSDVDVIEAALSLFPINHIRSLHIRPVFRDHAIMVRPFAETVEEIHDHSKAMTVVSRLYPSTKDYPALRRLSIHQHRRFNAGDIRCLSHQLKERPDVEVCLHYCDTTPSDLASSLGGTRVVTQGRTGWYGFLETRWSGVGQYSFAGWLD